MNDKYQEASQLINSLVAAASQVIKGKESFIQKLIIAMLTGGHVLIEDVPGLGKTTAAKTLAKLIDGMQDGRIQCTPDLLPYDITGVDVYEGASGNFHFEAGPIFCDILLADEINRATPKTQSALLEAMAEGQVTVGGRTYRLSPLFFVVATQNPLDSDGAYPLPAAELDRFMFKLEVGYPALQDEFLIVKESPSEKALPNLKPLINKEKLSEVAGLAQEVFCADELITLAIEIAVATRNHPDIALGVSPRGVIQLIKAARVEALFNNRSYVTDADILKLVAAVYGHRLILAGGDNPKQLINRLAEQLAGKLLAGR
ncbi:MAG: AAA family ATPase [Spirochaetaceae bacterium]|nr:AAA family ATPase [Spirochaetaceae bacterium]